MAEHEFEDRLEAIVGQGSDPQSGQISEEGMEALREAIRHCTLGEFEIGMLFLGSMEKGERREADKIRLEAESRKMIHERRADSIRDLLTQMMPKTMELQDASTLLTWSKSTKVEVVDIRQVPKSFLRTVPEKQEVNKLTARPLMLKGETIPGLELKTERKLEIK